MTAIKLSDFFGLKINRDRNDVSNLLLSLPNLNTMVSNSKTVKELVKEHGRSHGIVKVAKRQQALKALKPLLNANMAAFDNVYYVKEVNTASDCDRKYGAEEKLIEFSLVIATARSLNALEEECFFPNVRNLRELKFKGTRYDKLWEVLGDATSETLERYKFLRRSKSSGGFFSKLFN